MWFYTGIIASVFCFLVSAGLTITSWGEAGPGLVVFALLTLFWAKMLFTMLRQARKPDAESAREQNLASGTESEPGSEFEAATESENQHGAYTEPVGSPTVFVPHWFLMGAIVLASLLVCLAIILPLLAK